MPEIYVRPKDGGYFFDALKQWPIYPLYGDKRTRSLPVRAWRKLTRQPYWDFAPWFDALKRGERIIMNEGALHDPRVRSALVKYHQNIIIYTWDTIDPQREFLIDLSKSVKVYSHDRSDCRKYGFTFQTTFYHRLDDIAPADEVYDLVYLGSNKRRLKLIDEYYRKLADFNAMFYVFMSMSEPPSPDGVPLQSKFLNYREYLRYIVAARGILDIVQIGQDSLTIRVMEALFYRKKLVTTYQGIVHEAFYNPANIMVVEDPEKLDKQQLRSFLDSDYVDVDPDICRYYQYENWLKRFE